MNKLKITVLIIISLFFSLKNYAQQKKTVNLTLKEVVRIAKEQSPNALMAKHKFKSSYWQYRTFKANYLPQVNFSSTLPDFSKSIDKITLSNGDDVFIKRRIANSNLSVSVAQKIGLTGGQIFLNSNVTRLDIIGDSTNTSFLTTPINIGLSQPVFAYNPYKWEKKIQPLEYQEAEKIYLEDMEQVAITATNYFFDMLLSQIKTKIEYLNKTNNDTLYKIARGRYNLGTIAENDLLQLQLSLLNSNTNYENQKLSLMMKRFKLKSFLRFKDDDVINLIPPDKVFDVEVNHEKAVAEARQNASDFIAFNRKILEQQREVSKAKLENRFSANIYAVYGLTQSADGFMEAYKNPLDQEQIRFGIQVPIIDWGLAKGKIKMAESNQQLIETSVEQEQIDFNQNVFLKVSRFNMQKNQLKIAAKSDTVAQKRYMVTKQRYLIGKISITELNIAQAEKDGARESYINTLWTYWSNYYELRKLCLYDFINDIKINFDVENLK